MSVLIFWELENIASISFWVLPDLFVSYSAEKKAGSVAFVTFHSEYLVGRTALKLLMVFLGCFVNFSSVIKSAFRKLFSVLYWSYRNTDVSLISLFFFFFCRGKCCLKRCYMQWHVILLPIFKYSHRPHVLEGKMSILRQLNEQIPF